MWRWTHDPVQLLLDGAAMGPVFRLRLWRPVLVGYRPTWNRAVLGDLDTFRSHGSLSKLTPYLSSGVVYTDNPQHDQRRTDLNPHFHRRNLQHIRAALRETALACMPRRPFDALTWASAVTRQMLNIAFFGGGFDAALLTAFLRPLQRPLPGPMLPRPRLFARVDRAVRVHLREGVPGTLTAAMAGIDHAVDEIRVGLAAGYDTTAHTLAWALWHLAHAPQWGTPDGLDHLIDETLRLYPAGWLGSRITAHDTVVDGVAIPARTMVLYSPLLTHRDPQLWPDPATFRPQRHLEGRPAWGFLPFSAGRRTCLGSHLAREMLRAALEPFCSTRLTPLRGDPAIAAGITLHPRGPLWLGPASARPRSPLSSSAGRQHVL